MRNPRHQVVLSPTTTRLVARLATQAGVPLSTMLVTLIREALTARGARVPRTEHRPGGRPKGGNSQHKKPA